MKRITPEEVLEAYEKTGLKPMQGGYYKRDGCACALGALARHWDPTARTWTALDILYSNGISDEYHSGFFHGFDNLERFIDTQAYMDGQAAWEAVKHLAEVTP